MGGDLTMEQISDNNLFNDDQLEVLGRCHPQVQSRVTAFANGYYEVLQPGNQSEQRPIETSADLFVALRWATFPINTYHTHEANRLTDAFIMPYLKEHIRRVSKS